MRACRIDANQPLLVEAFRKHGCTVAHTHMVGGGYPDISVGLGGRTYLVEIKDGSKPLSARKLTIPEQIWHDAWSGHVCIAETVDDVAKLVSAWRAGLA